MESNNEIKQIGQRIRATRIAKGMSQADLAFETDISLPHISDIELGKKQMSLLTFCKIINVLQVSADEILRPNIPKVNQIYQSEFTELLSDCSPAEIESILNIVKEVKISLHKKPTDNDT